jgi:uncharacterized protein (TIRG00374 family)
MKGITLLSMAGRSAYLGPRISRSAWLRPVVVGVCLGSLALWLAFRGLDFGQLLAGLRYVNYPLTAAALLTTLAALVLGALRWQLLFYPDHRQRSFAALFRANVIGQMLNIAIPVRVGEIARIYAVADDGTLSKARVLGTLAVEKALDLAAFALAVVAVLALVALPPDIRLQQHILWIGGVGGVVILWTLARRPALCSHAVGWMVAHLPTAWRRRAERTAGNFIEGLSVLHNSWAWLGAIVLTLALVALAASTNYLLFLAFGLRLPPVAALSLLVVLQVGAVPPSLPGKVGIFHYLTVVALALFGVDRATALSYAIVLYGVALLPKILLGAGYVAVGGRRNGKAKALPYREWN